MHPQTAAEVAPAESLIQVIRGQKVLLDTALAALYEVPTLPLNEAVKRNRERFPDDFMFQLTAEDFKALMTPMAMSKSGSGGRRTLPYASTEHGVAMLSSVLNSEWAIQMNIFVVRAFIRIRELAARIERLANDAGSALSGGRSISRRTRPFPLSSPSSLCRSTLRRPSRRHRERRR